MIQQEISYLQNDKILLCGISATANTSFLSLARFLPNGQLDTTTFGAVGSAKAGTTFVPFNISGQNYDFGVKMIAQPNNMITFGAYTSLFWYSSIYC